MSLDNVRPDIDIEYYIKSTIIVSIRTLFDEHLRELHKIQTENTSMLNTILKVVYMLSMRCAEFKVYKLNPKMFDPTQTLNVRLHNIRVETFTESVSKYKSIVDTTVVLVKHKLNTEVPCQLNNVKKYIDVLNEELKPLYSLCPNPTNIADIIDNLVSYTT